jgi:hypothetical protein
MVPLIDRGGAVNHKGEGLISGDAKGEGVGAHARLDTKGGCDGWTGVGPGESDASLLGGHCGVVSCDAILETVEVRSRSAERRAGREDMGGILRDHKTNTKFLCLCNCKIHTSGANDTCVRK